MVSTSFRKIWAVPGKRKVVLLEEKLLVELLPLVFCLVSGLIV
jgi:hypothetical protein